MKSWTQPTDEMLEKVTSSVKKETDRQYFFSKLKNPLWIPALRDRGYFSNPPGRRELPDGFIQFPHWPELKYLATVAEEASDQVIEIVLSLPQTDNPKIYDYIFDIVLKLEEKKSAKLLPKIVEGTLLSKSLLSHRYPEVLQYWTAQGNINQALELVKILIPFLKDPRAQEKYLQRKLNPNAPYTNLDPAPNFDRWEYQQIFEIGIRPLADREPYQVAIILISAVADMIRLSMFPEDLKKRGTEDFSEIWCPRLANPDQDGQSRKEILTQTLTYACEKLYMIAPEYIDALEQALRKNNWKVFTRLRQHLYALHPNDQTLPWIREQLLDHEYSNWEHHYEFQQMVRNACEHFGVHLFVEDEFEIIYADILNGPPKADFQEWMGERYSEDAYSLHQRRFHRMQLRPFAKLLNGKIQEYYQKIDEEEVQPITDDSYKPYGGVTGGSMSYRSPKSRDALDKLTDHDLLVYLNALDDEHKDSDNWLIEINIFALADVFQSLFKDTIIRDNDRLGYWIQHRDEIARPIYVATMVNVMSECIKEKNIDKLDQWISFCAWVVSHQETARIEGRPEPRSESREHPCWDSSRRAVIDFIDICINKDVDVPLKARNGLANLLRQICCQFSWRLDHNKPVLLNEQDPLFEAINNTRSRALSTLIHFGFWIRSHLPDDNLLEVTEILDNRVDDHAEIPLTQPEHAILGRQFANLYILNSKWLTRKRKLIFPQKNALAWKATFSSYLQSNHRSTKIFEILKKEYDYALDNLNLLADTEDNKRDIVDRLSQNLFIYYLWDVYPLTGEASLLERFYSKTNGDRKRWAQLFNNIGRSLKSSSPDLEQSLTDRAIAFFDWRFKQAEPLELQKFSFWLEAECLDPEWRLRSYSKVLDFGPGEESAFSYQVKSLHKLLPYYPALVVECFSKIADTMGQQSPMFILAKDAKPILKTGLNSDDENVRQNAIRARERLLRLGSFEYLDLE